MSKIESPTDIIEAPINPKKTAKNCSKDTDYPSKKIANKIITIELVDISD